MRFWRFLRYEGPYLCLYGLGFLVVVAVFVTDPRTSWQWDTVLYAFSLVLLLTAGFFVHRYMKNVSAIRRMDDEESEPLSLEASSYRQAMTQMKTEHIRELNDIHARQREHYDFIVSWFHEIKTPIAVLRLMQQTEVDARSLEEELSRIEQYLDQALYYAKLDSFSQDYEIMNCDLEPLTKAIVKQHAKTFITRKIGIRLDLQPTIVQSDAKWLQFIVNQLVINSLKYTDEHGQIAISTRVTQQEKQLVVRDNGIGIDPKDVPRIFNRGFTGTNGRTHWKSTGMGLYLAQQLSNKLGHYITCESEAGRYTAMTVHFPRNHDPYRSTLIRSTSASD